MSGSAAVMYLQLIETAAEFCLYPKRTFVLVPFSAPPLHPGHHCFVANAAVTARRVVDAVYWELPLGSGLQAVFGLVVLTLVVECLGVCLDSQGRLGVWRWWLLVCAVAPVELRKVAPWD